MNLILTDKPLSEALQIGEHQYVDVTKEKINPCMGCFGCWIKTPGKCVIRDSAVTIYPLIAQAENVLYISRIVYGSYDVQAFIRIHNNETHHVQRSVTPKKAVIIAYGAKDDAEKDVFRKLVSRNANNMIFTEFEVIFCNEEEVDSVAKLEMEKRWN